MIMTTATILLSICHYFTQHKSTDDNILLAFQASLLATFRHLAQLHVIKLQVLQKATSCTSQNGGTEDEYMSVPRKLFTLKDI